jgi:hypothetical protein
VFSLVMVAAAIAFGGLEHAQAQKGPAVSVVR